MIYHVAAFVPTTETAPVAENKPIVKPATPTVTAKKPAPTAPTDVAKAKDGVSRFANGQLEKSPFLI